MELRQLRYFVAVANELSFSRAAQALHMAQPPLSRQIQRLEQELGVALFDRSRRTVTMTEAGRLLLHEATRLIRDADRTADLISQVERGDRISVDFLPSACSRVIPGILFEFRSRHPDVALTLRERDPDQIIRALEHGHTDIGFLYRPFAKNGPLRCEPALREPFVAALPERHPLAGTPDVALADLADDAFVLNHRYRDAGLYDKIVQLCESAGFTPRVTQETGLMLTTLSLVSAGVGVTLVPASLRTLQRAGVVYRTVRDCDYQVELDMLWRRDNPSPVVQTFVNVARQWAQSVRTPVSEESRSSAGSSVPAR